MMPHLFFYQLAVLGFLWLFVMLHSAWPSRCTTAQDTPTQPIMSRRQRSTDPKPFAGLTHKPHCALCEQEAAHPQAPPPVAPEPMPAMHNRVWSKNSNAPFSQSLRAHLRSLYLLHP